MKLFLHIPLLDDFQETLGALPFAGGLGPAVDGELRLSRAEAVATLGVDVEFGRQVESLVGEVEFGGFKRIIAVIVGDDEEAGRRVCRYGEPIEEFLRVLFVEKAAAVDEEHEVGPARVVDAVLLHIGAGGATPGGVAREVGAGGEPDHADALRINVPFLRVGADKAERPLQILDGKAVSRRLVSGRHTVADEDARHADAIKPFADALAFIRGRKEPIAATGADDNRGAVGIGGRVDGDRGFVDEGLAAGPVARGADDVERGFGRLDAFAWDALGPERKDGFGGQRRGGHGQEEERE